MSVAVVSETFKTMDFTATGPFSGTISGIAPSAVTVAGTQTVNGQIAYTSSTQGSGSGTANGSGNADVPGTGTVPITFTASGTLNDDAGTISGPWTADTFNGSPLGESMSGAGTFDVSDFSVQIDSTSANWDLTWNGTIVPTSTEAFDIAIASASWIVGGVQFAFEVTGPVQSATDHSTSITDVKLYYAAGTDLGDILGSSLGSVPVYWNQAGGTASDTAMAAAPSGATHVLVVADQADSVSESNEGNNVFALALPGDQSTIGLYNPATSVFYLRNSNDTGTADLTCAYGPGGQSWQPVVGDFNGDGADTIGLYDPSTSIFYLRNTNDTGQADLTIAYGPGGQGWHPIVGDFDGDGTDTIGLYDPSTSIFHLRNSNDSGLANLTVAYGPGGLGWQPMIGDFDGNGTDTIGLYDPSASVFYLRNSNDTGVADLVVAYGPGSLGWDPMIGDFDGDQTDTIGLHNPDNGKFYLRNSNSNGTADLTFAYGPAASDWVPLTGNWTGAATATDNLLAAMAAELESLSAKGLTSGSSQSGLSAAEVDALFGQI
ncbi:MAG: VCBS repeat-containing protein [Pirellulales bacterium]|nr:VCBS repeat-containing protein [Pirellulales bacterium]